MYNWSTDERQFKKNYPADYKIWRLLQLINYGLDGEKLNLDEIKKLWPEIKSKVNSSLTKEYLELLLNE